MMRPIQPGSVINDRYALERQIGLGGMASVWLADDRLLGRKVALKILSERYAADPNFVERFRREASAAASLSHQNIVAVYDRGEAADSYYIVMEHLPGPDLKQIIRKHGRLEPVHCVDAALQILAALTAAHRRDLIHRDIKPQNVLVSHDGQLKVTDFGIARAGDEIDMTEAGSVIGTAQYLSPEQARGDEVTTASDCYSVGVVLYEMLTGRVPFDGDTPVSIAMRQVNETPVAPNMIVPSIPDELNAIVMKALEKRPSSRYRTAEEFSAALRAVRPMLPPPVGGDTEVLPPGEDHTQVIAAAPIPLAAGTNGDGTTRTVMQTGTPVPPPQPPNRRSRRMTIIIALVVLLAAGLAFAFAFTDLFGGKTAIPSVAGLTPQVATSTLEGAGLRVDEQTDSRPDATIAEGLVIDTDPAAGTEVDSGTRVRLIISSGPQEVIVPEVLGRTRAAAARILEAEGLEVRFSEAFDSDVEAGRVSDQRPRAGEKARAGDTVEVVISKGADLVRVPNLKLMTLQDAEAALIREGLELGSVTERETDKRAPGTVLDLSPAAGTQVERGTAVNVVVAAEVTTVPMPVLVGLSEAEAEQVLSAAGLTGSSSTAPSSQPAGQVISQTPSAGTLVDPSSPITYVVSAGTVTVPTTTSGSNP